jgi:hypothetical protein
MKRPLFEHTIQIFISGSNFKWTFEVLHQLSHLGYMGTADLHKGILGVLHVPTCAGTVHALGEGGGAYVDDVFLLYQDKKRHGPVKKKNFRQI